MRIITPQSHHQQAPPRPPMVVSMAQPPPVSMQGLGNMPPMMGPAGGLPLMGGQPLMGEGGDPSQQQQQQQQPYHHHHHHPHHHTAPPPPPPAQNAHHPPAPPPPRHPIPPHHPPSHNTGHGQYQHPPMGGSQNPLPPPPHSSNSPYQMGCVAGAGSQQPMMPPQVHPHPQGSGGYNQAPQRYLQPPPPPQPQQQQPYHEIQPPPPYPPHPPSYNSVQPQPKSPQQMVAHHHHHPHTHHHQQPPQSRSHNSTMVAHSHQPPMQQPHMHNHYQNAQPQSMVHCSYPDNTLVQQPPQPWLQPHNVPCQPGNQDRPPNQVNQLNKMENFHFNSANNSADSSRNIPPGPSSASASIPHGSSNIPHGSSNIPHGSSNIPHGSSNIPHGSSNIPHGSSNIPHGSSNIPHGSANIPHGSSNIPHGSSNIPHGSSNIPHGSSNIPHGSSNIPHGPSNIPHGSSNIPHGSSNIPHGSSNIPHGSSNIPHGSSNIPQCSSNIPQGNANIPHASSNIPQGPTNIPHGSSNISHGSTNIPPQRATIPQGSINIPQGSANIPQGSTSIPQGSNIPQGSTSIPQGSTSIPQGSNIPQGSTSIPQGSTSIPQGSTSIPQGSTNIPQGSANIPQGTTLKSTTTSSHTPTSFKSTISIATKTSEKVTIVTATSGTPAETSAATSGSGSGSDCTKEKTPMCLVNELARYNKIQHQYCLTDEKGPAHKKAFTVTLHLGPSEQYDASGPSIKKAQHSAAQKALLETQYKHPPPKPAKVVRQSKLTPTVELNALAMKRGEVTQYTFLETPPPLPPPPHHPPVRMGPFGPPHLPPPLPHNVPPNLRALYHQKYFGRPLVVPVYLVSLKVGDREWLGEGGTAQQAKHNAADKALRVIKSLPLPQDSSAVSDTSTDDGQTDLKSPISCVHEVALRRSLTVQFEVVGESGPPHMRTFLTSCVVGATKCQGEGASKKISKKRAAELMLEELRKLSPLPQTSPARIKRKIAPKKKCRNLVKEQTAVDYGQNINPISRLIQIQQSRKQREPVYTLIAEKGVPRRREFVMQVEVGDYTAQGTGPNKKLAKRAAAESVLQQMGFAKPSPQPTKSAIKSADSDAEKQEKGQRKVTFQEEEKTDLDDLSTNPPPIPSSPTPTDTSKDPRDVPTPTVISKEVLKENSSAKSSANLKTPAGEGKGGPVEGGSSAPDGGKGLNTSSKVLCSTPAESTPPPAPVVPGVSTTPGGVRPKDQLKYLAQILGLQIQFTDFPKGNKSEYLSLVSLNTSPPHVSHGHGTTVEAAHDEACRAALTTLAEMGLDNVASPE